MGDSDNKGGLRRQKGWPGFVHGYSDYLKKAPEWDEIDWNGGTERPQEETRDEMGKIIQKW
jgi:hypothetical protein